MRAMDNQSRKTFNYIHITPLYKNQNTWTSTLKRGNKDSNISTGGDNNVPPYRNPIARCYTWNTKFREYK